MNGLLDGIFAGGDGLGALTVEALLLRLVVALVLSQVTAWVYLGTHRGISYTASLAQALVVMPLIVTLVMTLVGNSIARAFGLFGALALIRFRTPVKDARDTVFLFLAVALGIACGTGNLLAAVVGTVVICLVIVMLARTRFGSKLGHDGLLRLQVPAADAGRVKEILAGACDEVRLLHVKDVGEGISEFAFEVELADPDLGPELLAAVRRVAGVTGLSLLMQDTEASP